MKTILLLLALVAAAVAYEEPWRYYHSSYGMAEAARIKQMEQAVDFDGGRITGGSAVHAGTHPYLGGIVIRMAHVGSPSVCGSSLLSNTRSVTAAHCWNDGRDQAILFTLVWNSNRLFSYGTRIDTDQVHMHPQWSPRTLANDVAVINHDWVGFTNNINRINMAAGSNTFAGQWAVCSGFGRTGDNIGISTFTGKREVNLRVITNYVCRRTFDVVTPSIICTATSGGNSPCIGDSGGPLAVGSGNNRQLIGIMSFISAAGCTRGFPVAFTRVTSFNAWIRSRL